MTCYDILISKNISGQYSTRTLNSRITRYFDIILDNEQTFIHYMLSKQEVRSTVERNKINKILNQR